MAPSLGYLNGPRDTALLAVIGGGDERFAHPFAYDLLHDLNMQTISSAEDLDSLERFKKGFGEFRRDFDETARKYGVPANWLFGIAWAESRLRADMKVDGPLGTSFGLFQIRNPAIRGARSDEEVLDADTNMELAAKFLKSLIAGRQQLKLPIVASMYGAGRSNAKDGDIVNGEVVFQTGGLPEPIQHVPDAASPWDVAEPRAGYLIDVVRGANTAAVLSEESESVPLSWLLGLGTAATVAFLYFRRDRPTGRLPPPVR